MSKPVQSIRRYIFTLPLMALWNIGFNLQQLTPCPKKRKKRKTTKPKFCGQKLGKTKHKFMSDDIVLTSHLPLVCCSQGQGLHDRAMPPWKRNDLKVSKQANHACKAHAPDNHALHLLTFSQRKTGTWPRQYSSILFQPIQNYSMHNLFQQFASGSGDHD